MKAIRQPMPESSGGGSKGSMLPCDEIQDLLFDYMTHELGEKRAELVREHLRKCETCQEASMEIQQTMDVLRKARTVHKTEIHRLSEKSQRRIHRAILHPVLDWIYRHHILVAICVAVAVVAAVLVHLLSAQLWMEMPEHTYPVNVNTFRDIPTNGLPQPER